LTSVVTSTQLVALPAWQGFVSELLRAPQVPSARPVVAAEHAWQDKLHALSQQTPSRQDLLEHSAPVVH